MTSIFRSAAGGTLLLALVLGLPSTAVQADTGMDAARDNLSKVFNPTLREGATPMQRDAMAQQATPTIAQGIFERYWGFDQPRSEQRVSFAAFESVAQDNIDTLFKKQ